LTCGTRDTQAPVARSRFPFRVMSSANRTGSMSAIERFVAAVLLSGAVAGAAVFPQLLAGPAGVQTPPVGMVPAGPALPSVPTVVRAAPAPFLVAPGGKPAKRHTIPTLTSEPQLAATPSTPPTPPPPAPTDTTTPDTPA